MLHKKQFVVVLLLSLVILLLAGCGSKEGANSNSSHPESTEAAAGNMPANNASAEVVDAAAGPADVAIGKENKFGTEFAFVYIPVAKDVHPAAYHGMPGDKEADIHLEGDFHAIEDNKWGFAPGDWIPGMKVTYEAVNQQTGDKLSGQLYPMTAGDGPHYGLNVKMPSEGTYDFTFWVELDTDNFAYHDVEEWWTKQEFKYSADFKRQ
ncbi:iron transporter [Paenibacillus montanisoli]|uniref:Iron transporter n=1 Tax=Paenibacillus montanisoli TaxID=2081970 RepID=A0A328U3U7_9BACL|nr:iron transporter [Paenibacillus montanisoli]RAP77290.1 iron transporter [Paenibacillus montanisoli]